MSDDFFSNVPFNAQNSSNTEFHHSFAHAITVRFGSADLLTARLLPGDVPPQNPSHPPIEREPPHLPPQKLSSPVMPSLPATPQVLPPSPPQSFTSVPPSALSPYLSDPSTLILDIRPHAVHAAARVNHSLSLSVPTTLLKRPLFSLSKLSQMLPSPSSRARFADWPTASRILVYDSDSTVTPDNSIIAGLLRKFRAEGFTGELGWVRGGFQAVWKEARQFATTERPTPEEDDADPASSSGALRTTHLPKAAFSLFSTTAAVPVGGLSGNHVVPNTPAPSASRAANPFFDAIRQNVELSQGITERIPLRLPRRVRRRVNDLPFRWLQDIARRSAVRYPSLRPPGPASLESGSESSDDPHTSDPDEHDPDVEEGTEALAMQFYRIELAEQRRLRTIMEHHTRESEVSGVASSEKPQRVLEGGGLGVADRAHGENVPTGAKTVPGTPQPAAFPFSITAGVEKGTKNRYTHIWPFEHARVRLHDGRHQGSHPGKRNRRPSERGRKERSREKGKEKDGEQERGHHQDEDKSRRSRSTPEFISQQDRQLVLIESTSSTHSIDLGSLSYRPSHDDGLAGASAEIERSPTKPISSSRGPNVPQVKIEYEVTEQDSRMSEPITPATALPLLTPPFYTPMEISPMPTPMRLRPPPMPSLPGNPGAGSLGGPQFALPVSNLPSFGLHPSFQLRLPHRFGGPLPRIGETSTSETVASSTAPDVSIVSGSADPRPAGGDQSIQSDSRGEPSPADDYVNASYVQPLGTRKRYIATQGPLPSTFVDFWTLVWEQNVHVIVMLTREVENAMVKCGTYWTDTQYGPLRLELVSISPPISPSTHPTSRDVVQQGFFFAVREPSERTNQVSPGQPTTIIRTFALSHSSYPGVPPRRITHLQYLDWPDMNVPEDPRGILDLVKRVEQAVSESSPGPSPGGSGTLSGSLSPGSGSGSLSDAHSPELRPDPGGHDKSGLLSPTSGVAPETRKRGIGWRHPELDVKTGIAAFALGRPPPVLLHCSAGVGRTGGFIAVDAVLDGIKWELRKKKEEQSMRRMSVSVGVTAGLGAEFKTGVSHGEVGRELSVDMSTETGVSSMDSGRESVRGEGERMDIDQPTVEKASTTQESLFNTVPLHVSAGDRKKGWKRGVDPSDDKEGSSEALVVHVPYAGAGDVPDGTQFDDPKKGWQSSSTRQWAEQVSDQTHIREGEGELPPSINPPSSSRPASSRGRSPGSNSNNSAPSALNSADDSMGGSASGSASGSGSRLERKSGTGSASRHSGASGNGSGTGTGSGSGRGVAPSSISKSGSGSGSISLSNSGSGSGSGTGTGSRFGSSSGMDSSGFASLMRARLHESSATSVSAGSTDSLSAEQGLKADASLHQPSAIHVVPGVGMEVDHPPRPVSVPLQPTHSSSGNLPRVIHSQRHKPLLGSSPVASQSSPILPSIAGSGPRDASFFGTDTTEESSRPSSNSSSDEITTPPQGLESRESPARDTIPSPTVVKGKDKVTMPSMPRVPEHSELQGCPSASGDLGATGPPADQPVIDYKLPRELHSDLSPPPISSFTDPICMVIQDMREQRMSLCQSLRQYVFVHAAVIEGALRIVDEERELWGDSGTSDDGELGASIGEVGRKSDDNEAPRTWFGRTDKGEVTVLGRNRAHSFPTIAQATSHWNSDGILGSGQVPATTGSSSSGMSSPSKGKRGPSPTELLKEDKTGALSLNKRPSIKRNGDEESPFSFESGISPPLPGGVGGASTEVGASVSATRSQPGDPSIPEKGALASGNTR